MKIQFNIKQVVLLLTIFTVSCTFSQKPLPVVVEFDPSKLYQTIDNFAASDAWSCQFVGNWPEEKKNAIADLLFNTDTLHNGNPKGIGLSMWRYNIGAGSTNQGVNSGIADEWRRAAFFKNDSNHAKERIEAQNWFLSAAKKRGVQQFLGFFNSPPVYLTRNRKAFTVKGQTNIDANHYKEFANYAIDAIEQINKSTGVSFNYISPVNEPQWEWSDGKQEGCPYNNSEISKLIRVFNDELVKNNLSTKIIPAEAGNIKYLLNNSDKPGKDNQVNSFFNPSSELYIGNIQLIDKSIAYHSYFSTSPFKDAIALRTKVHQNISITNGIKLWQTEYCILGDNAGEIDGNRRDLGMEAALYVAKVIHEDLVYANASAWQWWLAISPYNYKDGLIYIDKNKTNGNYYDSKILWALGNYSFFVRPGMKRIEASTTASSLLVSAFKSNEASVIVIVNPSSEQKHVVLKKGEDILSAERNLVTYITDANNNLAKNIVKANELIIPAKTIVSIVVNND